MILDLLKSVVFAAIVSSVVALVVAVISARTAKTINREKLTLDRELAEQKASAELALAERRFELDRQLAIAKRRAEIAEKVLADFHAIKHAFQVIRSPMIWAGEMVPEDGVAEDVITNVGYGVMRRIRQQDAQFTAIATSRFPFVAMFGDEAAAPFVSIVQIHNKVFHAAESLVRYRRQGDQGNLQTLLQDMRRTAFSGVSLGNGSEELPDLVAEAIDQAVLQIEALCRPALESPLAAEAAGRAA